jgi:hypothetical protein
LYVDIPQGIDDNEIIIVRDKGNFHNKVCKSDDEINFNTNFGNLFGNSYEIHLQPDLTLENFFERFQGFYPLCLRFDYGVFVKEHLDVIHIETDQFPLPSNFKSFLDKKFKTLKLSDINSDKKIYKDNNVTIVTALWNMGRGEISDSFKRGYDSYLQKFSELLKTEVNMYIFIDPSDEEFIWKFRDKSNTRLNLMSLDELKSSKFNYSSKNENSLLDKYRSSASQSS